jgi:hypothetical protein
VIRSVRTWGLLVLPILLAGCAGRQAVPSAASPTGQMPMPSDAAAVAAAPPETATMVCGDEITSKVQQVLVLPSPPATDSTWVNSVYTCTYSLPVGPMTLTVHVLPTDAQAGAEFDADQARTPGARSLPGLGERAWGTPAGTAVVLKDNQLLTVDTTRLPEVFGANDQKRTDLAYEVASDVLGCWTGDGDE